MSDFGTSRAWVDRGYGPEAAEEAAAVVRAGHGCLPPGGPVTAAAGPPQVDSTTGEPHTGAMIALVPADPEALTVEGGEPADALHLTLGYLGETAEIPPMVRARILDFLESRAADLPPVEANVFGASAWNTTGDTPSLNLAIGGAVLERYHAEAWLAVEHAWNGDDETGPADWRPPEQHAPWVAHVCVMYGDHEYGLEPFYGSWSVATQLEGPVVFDRLRVAFAGEAHDFPLAGTPEEGSEMDRDEAAAIVRNAAREMALHAGRRPVEVVTAAAAEDAGGPPPQAGEHLRTVMHVQGRSTGLRTFLNLSYRATPFAFHWSKASSAHGGQPVVVHVGNVVRVVTDGDTHYGFVTLDLGSEDGAEYARRVAAGFERWGSIGLDETRARTTIVWPEADEEEPEPGAPEVVLEPEQVIIDGGQVAELSGVSVPAQADATIEATPELLTILGVAPAEPEETPGDAPVDEPVDDDTPANDDEDEPVTAAAGGCGGSCGCGGVCSDPTPADIVEAVTAAAWSITLPDLPPAEWFEEPRDVEVTSALTITSAGRVYGLVAPLGTGHRAYARSGRRLEVPFGNVDYSRFMGAMTPTAGGMRAAGALTMDCGHASRQRTDHDVAFEHYDNACSIIGAIAVGESRELGGVWMAGALLPGVRPDQIARALACRCSGDWQPHPDRRGWQEFAGCLLVPVPGFGTAHTASPTTTYDGEALVASAVPVRHVPTVAPSADPDALRRAAAVRHLVRLAGRPSPAERVLAALEGR